MEFSADATLPLVISAVFALSVLLFMYFFQEENALETEEPGEGSRKKSGRKGIFLRIFGRVITALGKVISTMPLGASRERLRKRLQQAGNPGGLNADEFHASRIIGVILAVLAGLFFDDALTMSPLF